MLAGLSEADDRALRMSTLAVLTNGSLSRLSQVVKRLENKGYARREPAPDDTRHTNAVLTEEGRRKVVAGAPCHVAAVRELVLDALAPGRLAQFGVAAGRVLENMGGACQD